MVTDLALLNAHNVQAFAHWFECLTITPSAAQCLYGAVEYFKNEPAQADVSFA